MGDPELNQKNARIVNGALKAMQAQLNEMQHRLTALETANAMQAQEIRQLKTAQATMVVMGRGVGPTAEG